MRLVRPLTAEFLGTFGLVFAGTAVVVAQSFPGGATGMVGIGLVHGLVLALCITATLAISGGHLNPAVTVALYSIKKIELKPALAYIGAQLAGGAAGAIVGRLLVPNNVGRLLANGVPQLNVNVQFWPAVGLEAVMTFFLMTAVMGTIVNAKAPKLGGLWVGLTVTAMIIFGGPLTGAALNPTRALGPAIVSGVWTGQVIYWIGPILGAIAAAWLWEKVLLTDEA